MLASLPDLILRLPAGIALLIVFLLPALEASAFVGFIFPGEIAVLLGGVLASQGRFPLWAALLAGILGAIIGDSVGYEVGKRWGDRIVHASFGRVPIIRHQLDRHLETAREYVRKRGPHAVFVGRFTAALRVLVPGLSGMADLPYPTFLLFNALGAIAWGTTFALLGYFAGEAWHRVAADAARVGVALLALVLVGLIAARALRAAREHGTPVPDRLAELRPVRWFRARYPSASGWLARRVDPTTPRGFRLSGAVVGAALGLWVFGALTQDVIVNDDMVLRDPSVMSWVVAHRVQWLTSAMRAVTWLGSSVVLIPIVVIVGSLIVWRRGAARPLLQLGVALVAGILAFNLTKQWIDRARPPRADWLVHAAGPSFPSGHSVDAAAVFGTIAVVLFAKRRGAWLGVAIGGLAVLIPVTVAASRVYLGVHWFTDAVAGLALGGAIVALVATATLLATPATPVAEPAEPDASGPPVP